MGIKSRWKGSPRLEVEKGRLPKLCGADIELGNFILGARSSNGTGFEASRALLAEIDGLPGSQPTVLQFCECAACREARSNGNPGRRLPTINSQDLQDWGRKYLIANGGCAYIDLDHLELCLPEVRSAYDHVACWHAMLRIARGALEAANQRLPRELRIQVLVNNSDGHSNSYGSHLNFLITRRAWDNIFRRRIHYLLYLAAFQVSSIVYSGQGKVGVENGTGSARFQLSQRADFFERLIGVQTTHNRPIVNSRDESLCGDSFRPEGNGAERMARLHVIFFDNTLCHVASLLKVGAMQILLAMIEAERVDPQLALDDPVEALRLWSRSPLLRAKAQLTCGKRVTAVELQIRFVEEAKKFIASGGCDGVVPRAAEILDLWEDTLLKLKRGDLEAVAGRLDWALKLSILNRVLEQRPDLNWRSPEIKHLDHLYSSLDSSEGLYWAYEAGGFVETVVDEAEITHFTENPPEDTRAWTRAMLLRRAGRESVDKVDWDSVRLKIGSGRYRFLYRQLDMASPLDFTRQSAGPAFENTTTLTGLLDALGATRENKKGELNQKQKRMNGGQIK